MRKTQNLATLATACALVFFCFASISAQNREKYVISAKAGGVNAVTGQATVHGKGESEWQQLTVTDDLNAGDRVRTASDGRVEILLNPGSYLRVGGNSEVELSNNSLENLELKLIRGTAIVEAAGADGLQLNISISTPHTKLAIVRHGLYRLNVVPGDATELIVRKGSVILNDSHTKVKGGNKVVFSATTVSVAKMTKEEKDKQEAVDSWSKDRGESLAKANRRINERMINSAFSAYNRSYFSFRNRGLGLWFYNDLAGCYTFLPFFYGFGSPYGGSYSQAVYFYGGHAWTGSQVPYYQGTGIPAGTTGNSSSGSAGVSYTPPPNTSNPGATPGGIRVSMPPPARNPDSGERMIRRPERTIEPGRP
jgi:FecR protein